MNASQSARLAAIPDMAAGYRTLADAYDEMMTADGTVRVPWSSLLACLERIGKDALHSSARRAHQLIASDGVIFNPRDLTGMASRPWVLDPVPALLAAHEWRQVEQGLCQRAQLWNLLSADLLGPQQSIRDRMVPAELLFGHPAYYPAYEGLHNGPNSHLTLIAAELARSPDGSWCVTSDRTRAPLGLGYALENRIITSRLLPAPYRQLSIAHLASFFDTLQEALRELIPSRPGGDPRIVIWSEGPDSHTFFEDAYLARYLGYTLVEGGDLAVRDQRLVIKTLEGPLPVDAVLRRVSDEDCDPVELNPHALKGVPGLLTVLRSGKLAMSNALGARIVESPAFLPFLPALCRYFLGEELRIPSVATWWCGESDTRERTLSRLDGMMVRPAFRIKPAPPILIHSLAAAQRQELETRIRSNPGQFVVQEVVSRSTTPTWSPQGLVAWRLAMRAFAVQQRGHWQILPGGLARVAESSIDLDRALSAGECSKDIWIHTESPGDTGTPFPPADPPLVVRRSGTELSSRVADHFFWLGRMAERADFHARLLRTVVGAMIEESDVDRALLHVLAETGQIEPGYVVRDLRPPLPKLDDMIPQSIFDPSEPGSLFSTIQEMGRLATVVRDRLAPAAWRILHEATEICRPPNRDTSAVLADLLAMLDRLRVALAAFAGLVGESMTRTLAWRFLELGRRIEGVAQTALLVRTTLGRPPAEESPLLEAVLKTLDNAMTYRARYLSSAQAASTLDLVLVDDSNPRSIVYQLTRVVEHLANLPRNTALSTPRREVTIAQSLLAEVRSAKVCELSRVQAAGTRLTLEQLMAHLEERLQQLTDSISHRYFVHAGLPKQFNAS